MPRMSQFPEKSSWTRLISLSVGLRSSFTAGLDCSGATGTRAGAAGLPSFIRNSMDPDPAGASNEAGRGSPSFCCRQMARTSPSIM